MRHGSKRSDAARKSRRPSVLEQPGIPVLIPLDSLVDAQNYTDGFVELNGDYGAIWYVACPARLVRCSITILKTLLIDLDALVFASPASTHLRFGRWVICDSILAGGSPDDLLLHPFLEPLDLEQDVRSVLRGDAPRLPHSAEELLKKGQAAQVDNSRWSLRLARLYREQALAAPQADRARLAGLSLAEFEKALPRSAWREHWMLDVAEMAFESGDSQKGVAYASWLIRTGWQRVTTASQPAMYGEYIHRGNIVLGKLALRKGDVEGAKRHLLEAGRAPWTISSPDKRPDMSLATLLLAEGTRAAVVEYLHLCSVIWKDHEPELAALIDSVNAGGGIDEPMGRVRMDWYQRDDLKMC